MLVVNEQLISLYFYFFTLKYTISDYKKTKRFMYMRNIPIDSLNKNIDDQIGFKEATIVSVRSVSQSTIALHTNSDWAV